jgi:hypothetical protein
MGKKEITYTLEGSLGSGIGLLGALGGSYMNNYASAIALIQNSQNLLLHDACAGDLWVRAMSCLLCVSSMRFASLRFRKGRV